MYKAGVSKKIIDTKTVQGGILDQKIIIISETQNGPVMSRVNRNELRNSKRTFKSVTQSLKTIFQPEKFGRASPALYTLISGSIPAMYRKF